LYALVTNGERWSAKSWSEVPNDYDTSWLRVFYKSSSSMHRQHQSGANAAVLNAIYAQITKVIANYRRPTSKMLLQLNIQPL